MLSKSIDYSNLMLRLVKDFTWPNSYMFKFIVPFEPEYLNMLKLLFSEETSLVHRESKNSKYISVTAVQNCADPDEVIAIYRGAEKIKNIIAL